jgi:hypothetical protein
MWRNATRFPIIEKPKRKGAKSHRYAAALFPLFVFLCVLAPWRFRCFGFVAGASDAADG